MQMTHTHTHTHTHRHTDAPRVLLACSVLSVVYECANRWAAAKRLSSQWASAALLRVAPYQCATTSHKRHQGS